MRIVTDDELAKDGEARGEPWICSKSSPKALAFHGHDWETASPWGVIIGVCKCRSCGVVSATRHFRRLDTTPKP